MKEGSVSTPSDIIIGIDLGTTNSLVAYMADGAAQVVKDKNGQRALVPSVIHFAENEIIVGDKAKKYLVSHPERTIFSIKRLLGKSYSDIEQNHFLGYRILDDNPESIVKIAIDEKYYTPIELSGEILKTLKARIEAHLGKTVSKAVITVPAYFNDAQRQATKDAGKLAGLDVLRIVNEPTAASLAYGIGLAEKEEKTIAVYDLGGGTFDISILQISDGIFEVLSTNGDTYLGGDDFDKAIMNHWIEEHKLVSEKHTAPSFIQTLRLSAEEAKKQLSSADNYQDKIEAINLTLNKGTFEKLIRPLVDKTIAASKNAMQDAGLESNAIDQIIMVGGSTRVPLVQQEVSAFFGKDVNNSLDPDEVVAMGAAIQADILAGNNKDLLLLDITPLSLGIETVGGLMDVIVPRNSKIPIKAGRNYTTSVDGQKNLKLAIYQGERDLVQDNRKLGEFILKDIPPMPAGLPKISIHFILDADGILKVRAMEERSNTQSEIVIKSQYGISEDEMALMLLDSIKNAESDVAKRALLEAKNEGNNVVQATSKFISQNQWLSNAETEQLNHFSSALQEQISHGTKDDINKAMDVLNQYSRPLAEKALDINVAIALKKSKI